MATINEIREDIQNEFITQWGTTTPFAFQNEHFEEPENASWVRLSVIHAGGGQHTLGQPNTRVFRRTAGVLIEIFTPKDAGTKSGDDLGHQARGIFEAKKIGEANFNDGEIREEGPIRSWFKHVVTVEFDYDELK